ncbi:unnamed protein product [Didymodactylos carnosus]|uniref:DDE Tnp4 domain-containing protein n=1 Tax=Didymodactylos carnosus TaxID=1234261 RepID=A0A8S2XAU6_9BILA|nr:unnamed protein product [Didymodactylos carnosus]
MVFDTSRFGLCEKDLRKEPKRILINNREMFDYVNDLYYKLYGTVLPEDVVICSVCRTRQSKYLKKLSSVEQTKVPTNDNAMETDSRSTIGTETTPSTITSTTIAHKNAALQCDLLKGEEVAILIMDGTYMYCQKSANNSLQRCLFSLHKKRPLLKPMVICTSTGYIVSIIGSYLSDWHNNDASIATHILSLNKENIGNWLRENYILVLDRGFRDCLESLGNMGYRTFMPLSLPKTTR